MSRAPHTPRTRDEKTETQMDDSGPEQWSVLVNDAGQHGLFPADLEPPAGWRPTGHRGTRESGIEYVDRHWTDLRPRAVHAG
ncbi:MbtH family NRPS accessory protein [Kitasatospora sp. NPDC054939]